jgi:aminoglycoside phosphotransferase (APT) family kinase protein
MTDRIISPEVNRLSAYLKTHLACFKGPIELRQFPVGRSNPTFLIKARSGFYVMRRQPAGTLLKSAHAVDREYRIIEALGRAGFPVPQAFHLCREVEIVGCLFYVMSYEPGRIFSFQHLPEIDRRKRLAFYEEMIRVLGILHQLDPDELGLSGYGKPGNYLRRQIERMTRQYRSSETETIPVMEQLMTWLSARSPDEAEGGTSLVHGDFHFSNVVFQAAEPRIRAVLDWELSTLGNPLADLAYFCMGLRLPDSFVIRGLAGKDRQALGLPEEKQIIDLYAKNRHIHIGDIKNWSFYLAFAFFRLAAIVQGVKKRGLEGTASNREEALQLGAIPAQLAQMAMEIIEKGPTGC